MNKRPSIKRTHHGWLVAVCFAGSMLGLFTDQNDLIGNNPPESQKLAAIGFFCAAAFILVAGLVERITLGLARGLQKVGGRPGPRLAMQCMNMLRYFGLFVCCAGLGIAVSAIWRGHQFIWTSLELLGPAAGLLTGFKLREKLFIGKESN